MKIILVLFLFLISFSSVFAVSNTIICPNSDSDCYFSETDPLINLNKIYPGFTSLKNFKIINERKTDDCNLEFNIRNNADASPLLDKILFTVSDKETVFFSKNLSELLNDNNQPLGVIPKNFTKELSLAVVFDQNADNNLQNLNTNFDFNFDFICNTTVTINQTINKVLGTNVTTVPPNLPPKIDYKRLIRYFCLLSVFSFLVYLRNRKNK